MKMHNFFTIFLIFAAPHIHASCFEKLFRVTENQKQYNKIDDQIQNQKQQLRALSADHYNRTFGLLQGFHDLMIQAETSQEQINTYANTFKQDVDTLLQRRNGVSNRLVALEQQAQELRDKMDREKQSN